MNHTQEGTPLPSQMRTQVRRWMRREMFYGAARYTTATALAHACAQALGLTSAGTSLPAAVYDIASHFFTED